MNNRLSPMGYAIVFVLLVAFIMIISSPSIIRSYSKKEGVPNNNKQEQTKNYDPEINRNYPNYDDGMRASDSSRDDDSSREDELAELERRLNSRLEIIERNNSSPRYDNSISDKYICSIEGGLNENGVIVPIDPNNPPAKFVFACEYRQ